MGLELHTSYLIATDNLLAHQKTVNSMRLKNIHTFLPAF